MKKKQIPRNRNIQSSVPIKDQLKNTTNKDVYDTLYDSLAEDVYDKIKIDTYSTLKENTSNRISTEHKAVLKYKTSLFFDLFDTLNSTITTFFTKDRELDDFLSDYSNVNDKLIEMLSNADNIIKEINLKLSQKDRLFEDIQEQFRESKGIITKTSSIIEMRNWGTEESTLFTISIKKVQCIKKIISDLKLVPEVIRQVEQLAIFEEENPKVLIAQNTRTQKMIKEFKENVIKIENQSEQNIQNAKQPQNETTRSLDEILILKTIQDMTSEICKIFELKSKLIKNSNKKVIQRFAAFNSLTCILRTKLNQSSLDPSSLDAIYENVEEIIKKVNSHLTPIKSSSTAGNPYITQLGNIKRDLMGIHNARRINYTINT